MADFILDLRKIVGQRRLIHPAARVLVENEQGEFLFIRRTDNGNWGLPAGGLEENENILECAKREVLEETGIELLDLEVIGIGTQPEQETVIYSNGDNTQYFTVEFYSNNWKGTPKADFKESSEVVFKSEVHKVNLPSHEQVTFASLRYFRQSGNIYVR
ncbi:MAG: NUDIX domain-containing protein [Bacteroidota bacterium]